MTAVARKFGGWTMAQVRLARHEAEQGLLPMVCVGCGEPATVHLPRLFVWRPRSIVLLSMISILPCLVISGVVIVLLGPLDWVPTPCIALPAGISIGIPFALMLFSGRSMELHLPFCSEHQNYWLWMQRWKIANAALFATYTVAGLGILLAIGPAKNLHYADYAGDVCTGGFVAVVAWLIVSVTIQRAAIHPTEVTEASITLMHVSEGFADAVNRQHLTEGPTPVPDAASTQITQTPASSSDHIRDLHGPAASGE
jgi:hypothetical protein